MAPRYRTGARGTAVAMTALLLAGCGAGAKADHAPAHAASAAPVAAVTTAPPTVPPTTAAAQWQDPGSDLVGEKILLRTGRRTGDATLPLSAKRTGGVVSVGYECQGSGKLTVTLDGSAWGETCSDAPGGTYNEDATGRSTGSTVRVTAGPGVTWAVAVGWRPRATSTKAG